MNIEINIDRQPVAARGVVARQISYKEMWEKVLAASDKLFVALQKAIIDKDGAIEALRSADQHITETQQSLWAAQKECAGLRGELEAANQHVKILQQRNEQLWDSYKDLRSTLNRVESSQNAQNGQGCDKNALNEQSSTRIHKEAVVNSVPVQNGNECNEQAPDFSTTDESIDELLKRLDKIAGHYGRPYGLPMAHKGTKQLLIDAVRNWVSGK